jgi:hypothetical protein
MTRELSRVREAPGRQCAGRMKIGHGGPPQRSHLLHVFDSSAQEQAASIHQALSQKEEIMYPLPAGRSTFPFCAALLALATISPFSSLGTDPVSGQTAATSQPGVTLIRGVVSDAETGLPLGSVAVRVVGGVSGALTDLEGHYSLTVLPGPHTLVAALGGYLPETVEVDVPQRGQELDFALVSFASRDSAEGFVLLPVQPGDTVSTEALTFATPDSARIRHGQVTFVGLPRAEAGEFGLYLFQDVQGIARAERIIDVADGHFQWIGTVSNLDGTRRGTGVFILRDGTMTGDIRLGGRFFKILPYEGPLHIAVEIDLKRLPEGSPTVPQPPPGFPEVELPADWRLPNSLPFPGLPPGLPPNVPIRLRPSVVSRVCGDSWNMSSGPLPEVRLLALYTCEVLPPKVTVGNLFTELELLVLGTNIAMETSRVPLRVTLAGAELISIPDTCYSEARDHLEKLQHPPPGTDYERVSELRNRYHADVVVLLVKGIDSGGQANIMKNVTLAFEEYAFAVVKHMSDDGSSFAHELGHVFGAQHERDPGKVAKIYMQPYHYNHGYVVPNGTWYTIMALSSSGEGLNLFSNPELFKEGVALGLPSTHPDAADVHRALSNTAGVVSAFRLTPVWFVSSGASAPWLERRVAEETLSDLGFGDFDGDSESDALKVDLDTNSWWWSRSASEPWELLNQFATGPSVPISDLAFGDFDGDGRTDVFRVDEVGKAWWWSKSGSGEWEVLKQFGNTDPVFSLEDLAFADVDGDGAADVVRSDTVQGQWWVSLGGSGDWKKLGAADVSRKLPVSELAFGYFDGDSKADVFMADGTDWWFSPGGVGPRKLLRNGATERVSDLAFGDFDGDTITDVLTTTGLFWLVSKGGSSSWAIVRRDCHRLGSLAFGDFDGDGTIDVFRAGIRP